MFILFVLGISVAVGLTGLSLIFLMGLINIFLKNLKNKEIFLFSNFKHIVSENKNILLKVKYLEEIIFMPKLKSLFN